jgi:hypothetical protein
MNGKRIIAALAILNLAIAASVFGPLDDSNDVLVPYSYFIVILNCSAVILTPYLLITGIPKKPQTARAVLKGVLLALLLVVVILAISLDRGNLLMGG